MQFICRLKAAFLGRRLQAAVAAGAAVAAVPGGGRGEMQKAEGRMQKAEAKSRSETAETHKPRKGDGKRRAWSSRS